MSIETTLITAALALLAYLLPSVAANLLRDQCIARGKLRAMLFFPGLWLGYLMGEPLLQAPSGYARSICLPCKAPSHG